MLNSQILLRAIILAAGAFLTNRPVAAMPHDGAVVYGAATLTGDGKILTIAQATPRAAIAWQGFDLYPGEQVNFMVPPNGATLNSINGPKSHINGQVTSNGTLYFVNENGFVFGPNSSVTAKNLIVTSHIIEMANWAENQARQKITPSDNRAATISLQGEIKTDDQGAIGVFGYEITTASTSTLTAKQGRVVLAAGALQQIDCDGDAPLNFTQENSIQAAMTVKNEGIITAPRGQISLIAQGSSNYHNAQVVNNGILDTSNINNEGGGSITLAVANGTIALGKGTMNHGINDRLIFRQTGNQANIVIDDKFRRQINYQPSLNLDFTIGGDVIIQAPLLGNNQSRMNVTAGGQIMITAKVTSGGLTLTGLRISDDHELIIGAGGLNLTSTGTIRGSNQGIVLNAGPNAPSQDKPGQDKSGIPFLVTDGGNITLTAENGGTIYVNNPMAAQNITMTSTGGGIGLRAAITATHTTSSDGNIVLHLYKKGNIWVEGEINANNLLVTNENGAIDFLGKIDLAYNDDHNGLLSLTIKQNSGEITLHNAITAAQIYIETADGSVAFAKPVTLKMIDPHLWFDHEEDRGKIKANPSASLQGGILHLSSPGQMNVSFAPGAVLSSIIQTTSYKRDDTGNLVAVTTSDRKSNPQEISINTLGFVTFNDAVGVRAGGVFKAIIGDIKYKDISANHANIALTVTNKNLFISVGQNRFYFRGYADLTNFDINEHVHIDQAATAYFNIPGRITVSTPINARVLTLRGAAINFNRQGRIDGHEGDYITLSQRKSFDFTWRWLEVLKNYQNVNLFLRSDQTLTMYSALHNNRPIVLNGQQIVNQAFISSNHGGVRYNYLDAAGNIIRTAIY